MNSQVPYLLRDIVRQYGMTVVSSAARCDAYLADLLFEYNQERRYLVAAVKIGVVEALLLEKDREQLHLLSKRLAKQHRLESAEAWEIIEAWRFALSDNPLSMESIQPVKRSGIWALVVGLSCCLILGGFAWLANQYWPMNTEWDSANSVSESNTTVGKPIPVGEIVPMEAELESMLQAKTETDNVNASETPTEELYIESDTVSTATVANTTDTVQQGEEEASTLPIELGGGELDKAELTEKSKNALYALQRFAQYAISLQKKKKAQETVGQLWQNTRQPYYQQQYQTLGKQIQDLDQQLENAVLQYGVALDTLCALAQRDAEAITLTRSSNDDLYKVMEEHLGRCKSGNNTNRQQLEKDLQQFSSVS